MNTVIIEHAYDLIPGWASYETRDGYFTAPSPEDAQEWASRHGYTKIRQLWSVPEGYQYPSAPAWPASFHGY